MNIIPFRSQDFFIRALDIDGEPWFIGKDVAEALGYSNTNDAIKSHCKGVAKRYPLQTAGGMQNVRIINEPDLFRLVVNSRLASAEKFERWVFEEVLPSIRKTGGYQSSGVMLKQTTEAAKSFATFFRALRLIGLDKKAGEHWTPTGEGVAFSRLYDTGKRYDNGTMITQLKWSGDVLPHIKSQIEAQAEASNQPNLFEERRACL